MGTTVIAVGFVYQRWLPMVARGDLSLRPGLKRRPSSDFGVHHLRKDSHLWIARSDHQQAIKRPITKVTKVMIGYFSCRLVRWPMLLPSQLLPKSLGLHPPGGACWEAWDSSSERELFRL